jgi:hypothetical protein
MIEDLKNLFRFSISLDKNAYSKVNDEGAINNIIKAGLVEDIKVAEETIEVLDSIDSIDELEVEEIDVLVANIDMVIKSIEMLKKDLNL